MLSTTRFDEITWQENCAYRKKHNLSGPIYCAPMKMRETIPIDTLVFVIEMKNLKKKKKKDSGGCIEGIGLIKNRFIPTEERHKYAVYEDGNYERYIYKGTYRTTRCHDLTQQLLDARSKTVKPSLALASIQRKRFKTFSTTCLSIFYG